MQFTRNYLSSIAPTLISLTGAMLLLAACGGNPAPHFPDPDFQSLDPIRLDIANMRYANNYRAPGAAPNVDHLLPVSIARAATRWAEVRLHADGKTGEAVFIIEEASVIDTPLDIKEGIVGAFLYQAAHEYRATLTARLVVRRDPGTSGNEDSRGDTEVTVARTRTLKEDAGLTQRDIVWHEMMEKLMQDLNAEMEENIRRYLGDFVN